MARTKQTARQSTGDIAPRAKLRPRREQAPVQGLPDKEEAATAGQKRKTRTATKSTAAKRAKTQAPTDETRNTFANGKAIADFPDATPNPAAAIALARVAEAIALGLIKVIDFSNSYCYGCQNGGASIACDECPRIICLKHVPQIEVIPETTRDKLHFRCPSCHSRATQNKRGVAPYFGLYHVASDGTAADPYLAHWSTLILHAARPQHAQVDTRPLLILSIRLVSLTEDSCPARFLYHYLEPWFDGEATSHLRYIDLPYCIVDTGDADRYRSQWDEVLTALGPLTQTRIILFIYTHSHDEDGDLFYAPKDSSDDLTEWWKYLICNKLKEIATTKTNDLTVAVLACGAIIRNERPRGQLVTGATQLGAKRMFAFATSHLQAVLTVPFFMNFVQRVYLEGVELKEGNVGTVLEQSLFLARHTPIWFFTRATLKNDFALNIFDWSHLTMRPHGEDLGLQCPGCGSLFSRKGKILEDLSKKGKGTNDKSKNGKSTHNEPKDSNLADTRPITVACLNPGCTWSKTFHPSATGVRKLTLGEKGQWRSRSGVLKTT